MPRNARARLSRLPVVACREPSAVAHCRVSRADARSALRRRARGRLERAPRRRRHARRRLHEQPVCDHPHAVRRAQGEGRDRRPVPRRDRCAPVGRRCGAGRSGEPAPRSRRRDASRSISPATACIGAAIAGPQGAAPLKENLAAAVLLRAGWPTLVAAAAADGEALGFVDPMCGSGTLCIEAASIAADVAPGFGRSYFGFLRWRGHDAALWQRLLDEASERRAAARTDASCDPRLRPRRGRGARRARERRRGRVRPN